MAHARQQANAEDMAIFHSARPPEKIVVWALKELYEITGSHALLEGAVEHENQTTTASEHFMGEPCAIRVCEFRCAGVVVKLCQRKNRSDSHSNDLNINANKTE